MLQHDRYTKIKEYLIGNKAASTAALAEHLGVSPVTIRKDLDSLEQSGIVKRTHGGAMLAEGQQAAPQICACKAIPDRMKKIAELAKNYVLPGDFVFLGSGRTCLALAECIKDIRGISIITNNVSIVPILKPHVSNIILLGGEIIMTDDGLFTTSDANVQNAVSGMYVNKAFSSGVGIDADIGLTVNNMLSTYITRVIPQLSEEWYVMIDSSKFGVRAFYQAAEIGKFDHLITDVTDENVLNKYKARGIDIIHP